MRVTNYFICFENHIVGYKWLKQFYKQNSKYYIWKQILLVEKQKHSYSVHNISNYFEKIQQVIKKKKIIELDVKNIDKTEFWIGYRKA